MKIDRSKNAARNVIFSSALQIYNILLPFAARTVFIYTMGMEYLGLNSLFTSILQVLNLAELGVGTAMVFSMYKPIAEDDTQTICALMLLYKKYYRIIGFVIFGAGLILTPFVPKLISGSVPPDINIYVLYLMNLLVTVLSYWLFSYKNCLINAHQRIDISSKIQIVIFTLTNVFQILVLFITKNYYYYVVVSIVMTVATNITTALVVDKIYPNYHAVGKLPKKAVSEINQRVKDLFTAKLGNVVVNSADTLVISAFLGLQTLAVYNNYYYILNSVFTFVTIIFNSCTAGIGNSFVVETKEKNFKDLKMFLLLMSWIGCFCTCCFACLYQPFIELWVGSENMLDDSYVWIFCAYFYIKVINALLNLYKDAAGIWHEDRFRALITSAANLVMNLIMVQFWGLYGVLLSTILSMLFVGMPWLYHNLFTVLFKGFGSRNFILKSVLYALLTAVITFGAYMFSKHFITFGSLVLTIAARGVFCAVISNLLFFVIFLKTNEFKQILSLVDGLTKGKIPFLKKLQK